MSSSFTHAAMFHRGLAEYLTGTVSFLRTALAADQPIIVAAPTANTTAIQHALGDTGDRVHYVDLTRAGRNPARIIPAVLAFTAMFPGRRVAIVGQPVWPTRTAEEHTACAVHEALVNTAFASVDATVLCPYDITTLPPECLHDATRTHPLLTDPTGTRESPGYAPDDVVAGYNQPLPTPPDAFTVDYGVPTDLTVLRGVAIARAEAADLPPSRGADLALALTELATNTLRHTTAGGHVAFWTEPDTLVCQVVDTGHITRPLAGRLPVPPGATGGRGLLLVHQLCDLVRIHTEPGHTTVRLYVNK